MNKHKKKYALEKTLAEIKAKYVFHVNPLNKNILRLFYEKFKKTDKVKL